MANAFVETKNLFTNYTKYTSPLSYEEWLAVADDSKAAVLYVQFYDQITLAWYKTKSFFVLEEDGVSTVIQYLMKNVPILKKDPSRFKPSYIYQVAYNCLYCISHDIKRDIERYEREISNIVGCDDDELDLFDTVTSNDPDYEEILTKENFWAIIEDMGLETAKVVEYLLNDEPLKKKTFRSKDPSTLKSWEKKTGREKADAMFTYTTAKRNYENDPLKDIEVTAERAEEIIQELRSKLANFKCLLG